MGCATVPAAVTAAKALCYLKICKLDLTTPTARSMTCSVLMTAIDFLDEDHMLSPYLMFLMLSMGLFVEGVTDILCSHCLQSQLPELVGSHPLGRYAHSSNLQFLRTLCRSDAAEGCVAGSPILLMTG